MNPIVTKDEWRAARTKLLAREKEFTRLRDELSAERRRLPWVRLDRSYVFDGPAGKTALADLFGDKSQLIVYHFMFGPDWQVGCKSCSFWADNFNGITAHLAQRDVAFAAVSRAPLSVLQAFARRLGWSFTWVSSLETDFNQDFHVSSRPGEPGEYNFAPARAGLPTELPGISVFAKSGGTVYHTYSCYARGLDMMNTAYHYLDLVPKGRDEGGLANPMAWVDFRDRYAAR
jgi:predicted dithiol-disulfide oxidoreductase (DUF899 family)